MSRCCVYVVVAGLAASALGQNSFEWASGSGSWGVAANWSPVGVPGTLSDDATLGMATAYTVNVPADYSIGDLFIPNVNAVLDIPSATDLTVSALDANGVVRLNPGLSGSSTLARLSIRDDGLITGTGAIELYAGGNTRTATIEAVATLDLTVTAGFEIRGAGQIVRGGFNGTIFNEGLIVADGAFGPSGLFINNRFSLIDQTGGGELRADDAVFQLDAARVLGGELRAVNGGSFDFTSGMTLENVTLDLPTLNVPASRTLNLENTVPPAAVTINAAMSNSSSNATLALVNDGTATLDWPAGSIQMFSGGTNLTARLVGTANVDITVTDGFEIRGTGEITRSNFGGTIFNDGLIVADGAFGPAPLVVASRYATIDQTGGGELRANNAIFRVNSSRVRGGEIRSVNGGSFEFINNLTLEDVTLDLPVLDVPAVSTLNLENTIPPGPVTINAAMSNSSSVASLTLLNEATATLNWPAGAIQMYTGGTLPTAVLAGASNVNITVAPGFEVRGTGQISRANFGGTLFNEGRVVADGAFGPAGLRITDRFVHVEQTAGAELLADGAEFRVEGDRVRGGTLRAINGGSFMFTNGMTLESVTLDVPGLDVPAGLTLNLESTIPVSPVTINADQSGSSSVARITLADEAAATLNWPAGAIQMFTGSSLLTASLLGANDIDITVADGFEVRGTGSIARGNFGGTLTNDGLIIADGAFGPAPLDISDRFELVDQSAGGELVADGATLRVNAGRVRGGEMRVINGGAFEFGNGVVLESVTLETPSLDVPVGRTLTLENTAPIGAVTVNAGLSASSSIATLNLAGGTEAVLDWSAGAIDLFSGGTNRSAAITTVNDNDLTIAEGFTVRGGGTISAALNGATLTNNGTLDAAPENGPARLLVTSRFASYNQSESGELIALASTDANTATRIEASQLDLGGVLRVELADGYTPVLGDEIPLFPSGGTTTRFDEVDIPLISETGVPFLGIRYLSNRVVLVVTCSESDLASPFAALDIADVVAFLQLFGNTDAAADLAAPFGQFDIADVITFLQLFGAGCP